jgi:hypothetical protein
MFIVLELKFGDKIKFLWLMKRINKFYLYCFLELRGYYYV